MDSMREELLAQFSDVTGSSASTAGQYLQISEWNLEQAIQLFFDSGGVDLNPTAPASSSNAPHSSSTTATAGAPPPPPVPAYPSQPQAGFTGRSSSDAIPIDDDDEDEDEDMDLGTTEATRQSTTATEGSSRPEVHIYEDDAALAQRLQQEMYAEAARDPAGQRDDGFDGIRAPIARTTETLVGPDDEYIRRMMDARNHRSRGIQGRGPVGIFNQRQPDSDLAWEEEIISPSERRRRLAQATNGASEASSRASKLAAMYNPPFDLITSTDFMSARDLGKENLKWIMVNIQDSGVFDSQVLNRDIWKDAAIKSTVKENFLFLQYPHDAPEGMDYVRLYLHGYTMELPHIGIIDPRTGELLKSWTRVPDKNEFLMQLHEFLERYSLDPTVKMPVQKKPKQKAVDVNRMTEEEMLDMALRNSLGAAATADSPNASDPDLLTKSEGKRKAPTKQDDDDLINLNDEPAPAPPTAIPEPLSPFASIAKDNHHNEPPANQPGVTRVQFRLPDGSRVVRRFALSDPVLRIFEYVKADLLPEQAQKTGNTELPDQEFELKSLRQNLIEVLDSTIDEAGLKMATIMVDVEN